MRSDTLLSLDEFIRWVGGNPWAFAQIDLGLSRYRDSNMVSFEHPEQLPYENDPTRAGANTRQAVAQAIRRAESQFLKWTKFYPVPMFVTNEEHPIKTSRLSTRPVAYKPKYGFVQNIGVRTMTEIDAADITLTREDLTPEVLDVFEIDVNVPDDTEASSLHIYLTEADGDYTGTPLLKHEIRPLKSVTIDSSGGSGNWTAQLKASAYLFVHPEFYEELEPDVLAHETATYVEEVAVWIESVDTLQPGLAVLQRGRCSNPPCGDDVTELICWERTPDIPGHYVPSRVRVVDSAFQRTTYSRYPLAMQFNYLAGYPRYGFEMDETIKDILCPLAIALMDGADFPDDIDLYNREEALVNSVCEAMMTKRFRNYRQIQKWEKRSENLLASGGQSGAEYELGVQEKTLAALNGLEPRRGFIKALQEIDDAGWDNRYGANVNL